MTMPLLTVALLLASEQAAPPPDGAQSASKPASLTPAEIAPPPKIWLPAQLQPAQNPLPPQLNGIAPAGENEITVSAERGPPRSDPAQAINTVSYEAVQAVDKAIIGPVARGYKENLSKKVRRSIRNVINNLDEPIVFVNFLLQFKPGKAVETLGRFAINSTVGVVGIMDVAKKKPFNLPRRSNGLADTLGYYGVGPGPYLFLPLIGSTTVRDVFGRVIDLSLVPLTFGKPFNTPYYAVTKGGLSALDERAEFDEELQKIRESGNPYAAQRTYYLNKRKAEILALHSKEYRDRKAAEVEEYNETDTGQVPAPDDALPSTLDAPVPASTQTPVIAPAPSAP